MPPSPTSSSRRPGPSVLPMRGSGSGISRMITGSGDPRKVLKYPPMAWRGPAAAWYLTFLIGALLSVRLGLRAEARMVIPPVDGQALFGQDSDDEEEDEDLPTGGARAGGGGSGGGPRTFQRLRKASGFRAASYG